ncbi:MAG: ATP-binding protein [Oligoflexia bacterium]|nr:ATP-binding protein [Oligoflexia bacterium]
MRIYSACLSGVEPVPVEVEGDFGSGLPVFQIVGLPDTVLRESRARIKGAITQCQFDFPVDQRAVLNLSPSSLKKQGSQFDLALAIRILAGTGQISLPQGHLFALGELSLTGELKSTPLMAPLILAAQKLKGQGYGLVPFDHEGPIPEISNMIILRIRSLTELRESAWWEKLSSNSNMNSSDELPIESELAKIVVSEFWAKHIGLAALGRLHYLLVGPPGIGKSFFAECVRKVLEVLPRRKSPEESVLDTVFGRKCGALPWAAPHHSSTSVGMLGSVSPLSPGAISKAHGGVLFLDEVLEFSPRVLDSLREPMEQGFIEIARGSNHFRLPSRFQLIATANPCRCGYWKHGYRICRCRPVARQQYQARLSGPLIDRFDVSIFIKENLSSLTPTVSLQEVVEKIRGTITTSHIEFKKFSDQGERRPPVIDRDGLSFRTQTKARKVSQLIALWENKSESPTHFNEALSYQKIDF